MRNTVMDANRNTIRSDAFIERAMEAWGGSVWRLALSQTGSKHDAEDAYQEVFVSLALDRTAFADQEHLKAWLLRVTINRCHDIARSRQRRPVSSIDDLPFEPVDSRLLSKEKAYDLWEAVEMLPENMRVVVHLYYYEGYSGDEIAEIVNTKSSTVRSRLQRAREQLRTLLGGPGNERLQQLPNADGPGATTCPAAR